MASDDDKTVFGQNLPIPPRPDQAKQPAPPAPSTPARPAAPPPSADKTVFGAPLPPAGGGRVAPSAPPPQAPNPAYPAPPPQAQPQYPPQQPAPQYPPAQPPQAPQPPAAAGGWQHEDTWLGGALNPNPGQPPQQAYNPAPPPPQQPIAPVPPVAPVPQYRPDSVPQNAGGDMFPEYRQPEQQQMAPRARISLEDALKGTGLGGGGSSNPLVAAAANLLILLGRLRTGLVEMQSQPLIEHVAREIDLFEKNALAANVAPMDASDAKYSLAATADDIVQNLPGADRSVWIQYSMVARFFGERSSGIGFFQKMDEAMRAPAQRFHLLELMLTCLSLGFEGQYRAVPDGPIQLARARSAIYESLRRVHGRPDDDISVKWTPVIVNGKRRRGGPPVWLVAAVAAGMIVILFATLSTLLTRQTTTTRDGILALHANQPAITIERTEPIIAAYQAPDSGQLERIRAALNAEIAAGQVEVDRNNEFIFVRLGNALQFGSGSAELTNNFTVLAGAIGRAFEDEAGPIRVVGHTDSIPPSGRGRYKTNEDLSVARAGTVADQLKPHLSDPARIESEGKGAVEPIADNGTREGRARNRRVEVMIAREDNL